MVKKMMKGDDGLYHKNGKSYPQLEGSRAQVWHGTAYKTAGGLTREKLMQDKYGNIKSRAASRAAKKTDNLGDLKATKGKFGPSKKSKKSKGRKTRKSRK